jgi:hypothetical protein
MQHVYTRRIVLGIGAVLVALVAAFAALRGG